MIIVSLNEGRKLVDFRVETCGDSVRGLISKNRTSLVTMTFLEVRL